MATEPTTNPAMESTPSEAADSISVDESELTATLNSATLGTDSTTAPPNTASVSSSGGGGGGNDDHSDTLRRKRSTETVISSPTSSKPAPRVPHNSTATPSVAGGAGTANNTRSTAKDHSIDLVLATNKLLETALKSPSTTTRTTPLASEIGRATTTTAPSKAAGKPHHRTGRRREVPLLQRLFKPQQPVVLVPAATRRQRRRQQYRLRISLTAASSLAEPKPTLPTALFAEAHERTDSVHEYFPEHQTWLNFAVEDLGRGLERLARAAKDEYKKDSSRSVKQYYSESLAKVLLEAEIEFDRTCLE